MPGQGRLGDQANIGSDAHGCPGCPHPGSGPAISGSADVFVNGRPALRVDDVGIHAACCGPNMWTAEKGSSTVFINGKPAHRLNDATRHCGGSGQLVEGSADVIVGDSGGGGGGGGGSGGGGGGAGSSGSGGSNASGASGANASESNASGSNASGSSGAAGSASPSSSAPAGSSGAASQPGAAADAAASTAAPPDDDAWIELELVGEDGHPIPGERYLLTPNAGGEVRTGFLDDHGRARVIGLKAGDCDLTFPDLDTDAWQPN